MHQRFTWVMEGIPSLSARDQQQLRAYLANPSDTPIVGVVNRLIDGHPQALEHFDGQPFERQRQLLGPLLLWGLHQPWAAECNISACLEHWRQHLTDLSAKDKPRNAAAQDGLTWLSVLDSAGPAVALPADKLTRCHAQLYLMLRRLVDWSNVVTVAPETPVQAILMPMTALAARCAKEKHYSNEKAQLFTIDTYWSKDMGIAMQSLSTYSQKEWLTAMMDQPMPKALLKVAFKRADPLVWLMPEFKNAILDTLPKDEMARRKHLKWTSNMWTAPNNMDIRPGEVNRMMHQRYCPLLYLGLEMVLTKVDDWEDRAYVDIFATSLSAPKAVLPLPLDFEADPNTGMAAP